VNDIVNINTPRYSYCPSPKEISISFSSRQIVKLWKAFLPVELFQFVRQTQAQFSLSISPLSLSRALLSGISSSDLHCLCFLSLSPLLRHIIAATNIADILATLLPCMGIS